MANQNQNTTHNYQKCSSVSNTTFKYYVFELKKLIFLSDAKRALSENSIPEEIRERVLLTIGESPPAPWSTSESVASGRKKATSVIIKLLVDLNQQLKSQRFS